MALRQIVRAVAGTLLFVSTLAAAALASGSAYAQNWDGSGLIRFGVFLQGSFLDYDINQTPPGAASFRQSASPNGVGVGISSGYDLRLGSFVVGAELDASFDDGGAKASPQTNEQYGIDYFATLRGRLGYMLHPGLMFYGTVGYGLLGTEYKLNGLAVPAGGTGGAKKYGTMGGLVYGGGVEYDMGWGIGFVEYLHSDTSGWDFLSLRGNRLSLDSTQDVVRLGMKFKVGHDHTHDVYRVPDSLK